MSITVTYVASYICSLYDFDVFTVSATSMFHSRIDYRYSRALSGCMAEARLFRL